jgi:hypothetical protein
LLEADNRIASVARRRPLCTVALGKVDDGVELPKIMGGEFELQRLRLHQEESQ